MQKMKSFTGVIAFLFVLISCAGMQVNQNETNEFIIESLAMVVGNELKNDFEWDAKVDKYYTAIMNGEMSIDGAKAVEVYFSKKYPPILVNRFIKIASLAGFDLNAAGSIIGVENVDIGLLQAAASGFKMGLELK